MKDLPEPGEVWIVVDADVGGTYGNIRYPDQPFIVTYISRWWIGAVTAGNGPEPETYQHPRGRWDWNKHCVRIWPPAPSWDELRETHAKNPDDLRSRALAGEA